jgi:hypothetical protein
MVERLKETELELQLLYTKTLAHMLDYTDINFKRKQISSYFK